VQDAREAGANLSTAVVEGFGDEWGRFDQISLPEEERRQLFRDYFALFPWGEIGPEARGADIGAGSGRWAALASERVAELHVVEPSPQAMAVARRALAGRANVVFHQVGVGEMPIDDASLDFAYSLGVLHHVPDTQAAIRSCVRLLKPGAPLLLYLYYAFDNRPGWYRAIWKASDVMRRTVSSLPHSLRYAVSQVLAATVYFPLARSARVLKARGKDVHGLPLSTYADKSFYTMRTDALDRLGTRLEQRFTRAQIEAMLAAAGCERIMVSGPPYWCAIGYRR
jgi:ubiquinone/menaquinone biosynthesis C-methylase UbiE